MTRLNLHFFAAFMVLSAVAMLIGAWVAGLALLLVAALFINPTVARTLDWRVMLLAVFLPVGAMAASIGTVANPLIDQFQGEFVSWIVSGALAIFWTVATWLGSIIGWRFIEKMNRATMQEAAERFANTVIDELQLRYLGNATPNLSDIVQRGVDYIKDGNAGTVKQSKIKDDRIAAYVTEGLMKALKK